jgi:hypothetical protein
MFSKDKVTGALTTSIIPAPYTSPVFNGEFPLKKSPCEVMSANEVPFVD